MRTFSVNVIGFNVETFIQEYIQDKEGGRAVAV